jgi:hypothetical protein
MVLVVLEIMGLEDQERRTAPRNRPRVAVSSTVALDWLLPVPRRWWLVSTSRPRRVRKEPAELTFQQPQLPKHVPCIEQLYNGTRRFNYITLNHKTKACLSYTQAGPHSVSRLVIYRQTLITQQQPVHIQTD